MEVWRRSLTKPQTAGRYDEPMAVEPATTLPLHRIDVETYDRMVASGALEGQKVELLEGVLVEVSPQSSAHATVITRLARYLGASPRWWVRVQMPIAIRPNSEPEPDLAVFDQEPPPKRHPGTALLAVEVSFSSQMIDRNVKGCLYARAEIPVYWLVDLPARTIEVRTQPSADGYRSCQAFEEGDVIPSPLAGVKDLDVTELLSGVGSN
jgi:Uma2 family endonuclease